MTLGPLFLTIVTAYLVLVAYGTVGARRRLHGRGLMVALLLVVLLPPAIIAGALVASGEGGVVREWHRLLIAMPVVGALVALAAEQVARRVAP